MEKISELINEKEKKIFEKEYDIIGFEELIWKNVDQILNFSISDFIILITKKWAKEVLMWELVFEYLDKNIKTDVLKQVLKLLKETEKINDYNYIKLFFINYNKFDIKLKKMLKTFDILNFDYKKNEHFFIDETWRKLDWYDIINGILIEFWYRQNSIGHTKLLIDILLKIKTWKIKSFKKAKKIYKKIAW